ncbi:aromatic acid/H+ symport family MFS transporter [Pseudonocardia hydrocarbonoxydans]|uniref:MFS transporter n=1 Tax=Pseudonocardia hydrocarbonoxydans TaxID=76726 RepID=A0A4Y3WKQ7_9PSEU|nr:MFS transporter [Pseudonocardia hydrocarbonoxydans]
MALEGYDIVVLGVVLPALLGSDWGLNPNSGALISVVGLLGIMVGALAIGPVADVIGRRRTMLLTVVGFSVLTLACAFAPGPEVFGLLRFLAGLGLGGVLPVALAMVNEYAPAGGAGSATTVLMTGYHVGAVATALLGIVVIPAWGWQAMFVIGALPALVLVPLLWRFLPESEDFLRAREPAADGPAPGNPVRELFRGGHLRATLAFWVTSVMGLLLVYGLNTWLPQIMISAGYELSASLALLLTLNAGAVIGLLVAGRVADRIGTRLATMTWFALGALFLALLSIRLPGVGVYLSVLLAGIFVFSAQVLCYAFVGQYYPAAMRSTALGSVSGVGRIGAIAGPLIGGALLTAGVAYPWGFYIFAAVAAVGAVAIAAVAGGSRTERA